MRKKSIRFFFFKSNMLFIVDKEEKVIIGWCAKSGCSHIKKIYWFFRTGNPNHRIHTTRDRNELPPDEEMKDYRTILIVRNPYKRLISGFLDKYRENGQFRNRWKNDKLTFSDFVEHLVNKDWKTIDFHHFAWQTSEHFNEYKLKMSNDLRVYDLNNIDYKYLESLYGNKRIPHQLLDFRGGHDRKNQKEDYYDYVYNKDMSEYYDYNVDTRLFFNEELKGKVDKFFKDDIYFLEKHNISNKVMG